MVIFEAVVVLDCEVAKTNVVWSFLKVVMFSNYLNYFKEVFKKESTVWLIWRLWFMMPLSCIALRGVIFSVPSLN